MPQVPQFWLSVLTLTQVPSQSIWVEVHVGVVPDVDPFAQPASRISAERKAVASDGKRGLRSIMIDSFKGNSQAKGEQILLQRGLERRRHAYHNS